MRRPLRLPLWFVVPLIVALGAGWFLGSGQGRSSPIEPTPLPPVVQTVLVQAPPVERTVVVTALPIERTAIVTQTVVVAASGPAPSNAGSGAAATPGDTPPGTILDVGERWRQGGIDVKLDEAELNVGDIYLRFSMVSQRPAPIALRYGSDVFSAADNRGRRLKTQRSTLFSTGPTWDVNFMLIPGLATNPLTGNSQPDMLIVDADLADSGLTEITIRINGLASVTNARWRIPVNH